MRGEMANRICSHGKRLKVNAKNSKTQIALMSLIYAVFILKKKMKHVNWFLSF
jgi:hypothetical protein